ncbi:DUF1803 domain-containing protein [Streptococcaceae bacterium ESL0729]|nr:DUF1803 domain-containing protein [Streptococcaceae bacterium ESL0729]
MAIKIYNENRLTKQPFFQSLITYLDENSNVTLRDIKREFPHVEKLDRKIEEYVKAGFISRRDRRYYNNFELFGDGDFDLSDGTIDAPAILVYEAPFFVAEGSKLQELLESSRINQILENDTNELKFFFTSDYARREDNLANYFYKLEKDIPLTELEGQIYKLIGDVNRDYALKYMTAFLLKYSKRDLVPQKRLDIFIKSLEVYGYIEEAEDKRYALGNLELAKAYELPVITFDNPRDFISSQLKQQAKTQGRLSLP